METGHCSQWRDSGCFSLRAKRFYSNLLYKRDLQRPDAICHFPRALVGNQAALMQDGESKPTSKGLTLPALHKIRDQKWGIVWRFHIYSQFILNGLVAITGTKKLFPSVLITADSNKTFAAL